MTREQPSSRAASRAASRAGTRPTARATARPAGRAASLRVIAGSARGVGLRVPDSTRTRPTAGRLRESLFAMLEAADVDFERVLDLYAGSGALGIEALSRGDGIATFVDADVEAGAVIRENLARTRFADRGRVIVGRVGRWHAPATAAYTLVLADPPYDDAAPWGAIETSIVGALASHATIVVEHDARTAPPAALAGRALWRERRQGAGAVAIYQPAGEDAA
ncbi:MAG: 16S rRNA (guanine(966)-N(2))-methyltransferase RsmD [Dehalococcoidia bacterium]|nr:16S rRNA (guanine(966)-N(2))-methyltransferase RsmD [Dehalococcoidia bacterium]